MSVSPIKTYIDFSLPPTVISRVDVSRLAGELERVDNELTAAAVRSKKGTKAFTTPVMSEQLNDFLHLNNLSLENSHERSRLIKQLRLLKEKVPVMHMTFAVAAERESLQQIIDWLRTKIHPQTVVEAGLQPALVAGVYLRTPNHIHDMSMRAMLNGRHDLLVKELESLRDNS